MHHCTPSFIHIGETAHELFTDPHRWKSDRGWKSTTIIITPGDIHFTNNRRRETKIGNDAIHDLQGGITKDAFFIGVNYDTCATTALCPFSLVGSVG
jgi:hypothetical protein